MTSECGEAFLAARQELLQPLPIHSETLGRTAVEAANVEAIVETMPTAYSDVQKQEFRDFTATELDAVRVEIACLEPLEASVINGYLNLAAPKIFRRGNPNPEITWTRWLSGLGIEQEEAATDAQLTNFLQWHVDLVTRQQESTEFNVELLKLEDRYQKDVADAIEDGNLSVAAKHALGNIKRTPVFVGDVFMTTMRDCGGFYRPLTGEVTVAQGIGRYDAPGADVEFLINSLEDSYYHEETHAEIESFIQHSPLNERWIREALTEHVSRSLREGEFDLVNPADRSEEGVIYMDERILLSAILELGNRIIDPSVATRAFSGTKSEQEEFLHQLDESWGAENFLEQINDFVATYAELFASADEADQALTAELSANMPFIEGMSAETKAVIYTTVKLTSLVPHKVQV